MLSYIPKLSTKKSNDVYELFRHTLSQNVPVLYQMVWQAISNHHELLLASL